MLKPIQLVTLGIPYFFRRVLLFSAAALICTSAHAQIFQSDQYRPSLGWRELESTHFRVLFPSTFEAHAQELTKQMEAHLPNIGGFPKLKRKFPIIFQTQSVESNGFVQLAPRRAELVTTAPPDGDLTEWLNHLPIHELRHAVQFDHVVGRLKAPFFEQLGLALYGLNLPSWYFEGDAVWVETHFTEGGRGKSPSWLMPLRANLLSGKSYSYEKNYLGSYKDITPGFYELGFVLVDKLYREQGEDAGLRLWSRLSKNLLRPYNFSRALREMTGYGTRAWHDQTMLDLQQKWAKKSVGSSKNQDQVAHAPLQITEIPLKASRFPENWMLPQLDTSGKIWVLHQGIGVKSRIEAWYSDGKRALDKPIQVGYQLSPHFSYAEGRLVWDEVRTHPRYLKENYNIVVGMDLATGNYREFSKMSRYFSPSLSADGQTIACVELTESQENAIVLLDWKSGALLKRIALPEWTKNLGSLTLETPSFDPTGQKLVFVAVSTLGRALWEMDLESGEVWRLTPFEIQEIRRPRYVDTSRLIFSAHYERDVNNIYLLDKHHRSIHRLTQADFGAFQPALDAGRNNLVFAQYTASGYKIGMQTFDMGAPLSKEWGPFERIDRQQLDSALYPVRDLRKNVGLFNFHSLSLSSDEFSSFENLGLGLYWLSDNLLNTVQTRLGYEYNTNSRSSFYSAGLRYQKFYPVLDFNYNNRSNSGVVSRRIVSSGSSTPDTPGTIQQLGVNWREHNLTAQISVPFTYYIRDRVLRLNLGMATQWTQRYGLQLDQDGEWTPTAPQLQHIEDRFINQVHYPLRYSLSLSHIVRRSSLDVGTRWGQSIGVAYRHTPFTDGRGQGKKNTHFALQTALYLPGLMRHHALSVQFNVQRGTGTFEASNYIPNINGQGYLTPESIGDNLLVHYRLPLAYPDWRFGGLAYVKRIRGGVFVDFQNIFSRSDRKIKTNSGPRTMGLEIRSDINLLRYVLPEFDLGARLIYVAQDPKIQGNWLFSYGLTYRY